MHGIYLSKTCAKNAGWAYARGGEGGGGYLQDTTVHL